MAEDNKMPAPKKSGSAWLNLLIDYGPVLVFFVVYKHFSPTDHNNSVGEVFAVIRGTAAFMVAAVLALAASKWWLKHISPMLWLTTALIIGFGSLTVLLHDSFWIQIKPTVIYLLFASALLIGVWRGKPLLKYLLSAAFEGLDESGWMLLSRNWGLFFVGFAVLNEVLRHYFNTAHNNFGTWLMLKVWLFMPLSFLFTFAQMPMLLKHGLGKDDESEVLANPPHD